MLKHAFLIIAHSDFTLLQILVSMLDDVRNDIYVHIDKKVHKLPILQVKYSELHILNNRIDVKWGGVSQIKTELLLFSEAANNGPYMYYHLLSGADLPIKSNDYLHDFFTKNQGKEFVGFAHGDFADNDVFNKVYYKHYFINGLRADNLFIRQTSKLFHNILLILQKFLRYKIRHDNLEFRKGCNWLSITEAFCSYVLKNQSITKVLKHSLCGDEIFIQTLLWNSPFKDCIYNPDEEFIGCMREIDWTRGSPYTWRTEDYDTLMSSTKLFARKFDYEKYPEIINKIYAEVSLKQSPLYT